MVAASSSVAVVTEDGNVDYCQICQKAGNIVCCDYCPRAFHAACMKDGEAAIQNSNANGSNSVDDGGSSRWECPTCIQEKERLPQDVITGRAKFENDQGSDKDCLAVVCEAFATAGGSHAEDDIRAMKVLSILLEMVQHLMDYDFGYMFQEPVDIQAIPEYATVVKQPMDLGTLADRLADGYYAKLFDPETKDWNRVIAQVLMDVELVWHNCFTFNFEGSAIFRMAEVCLRRARNIVASTLEPLVDDAVKVEVATYVKACERERAPMSNLSSSSFHIIP
ncbi:bromodomain-containing protein [Fragilaria crotonensis]|nr:bromodomain-containing protein [Fragilaria crotonensis]